MTRRRLILLLALLALVLIIVVWLIIAHRPAGPITSLSGNGIIEATEVDLGSKVPGRIMQLLVDEGQLVTRGQLIAILDRGEQQGQVTAATGGKITARENLAQLQAGSRPQEIQNAEAQYQAAVSVVQQARAQRDLVVAGPRTEEIAQLRAALAQAQAQHSLVEAGSRPEVIAQTRANYAQAQARLSLVRAGTRAEEIAQLQAALAQAQATLNNAETELKRAQFLNENGAIPGQQLDTARTQRDVAQAQVVAARQRLTEAQVGPRPQEIQEAAAAAEAARQQLLQAEAGSRPQEIAQARAQVTATQQKLNEALHGPRPQEVREANARVTQAEYQARAAKVALDLAIAGARKEAIGAAKGTEMQAQGNLQTAQASLRQTKIYAPTDARVTLRSAEPGDIATAGMPIVRLSELQTVWLRVYVPEPQVGLVKIGQRATVTTDAFPNLHFSGTVTEINDQAEFTPKNVQTKDERVKLVYGVKVTVRNPDQDLKPGMPGDAVIYVR